jgi:peroxiredoxin
LYKDERLIDTIALDKDNRFFKKFDSLTPGMYTFRHEPEYQYVYFEKNDSLMVAINSQDFDESIVFSGRGDEKNNFLMEIYLKNDRERDKMFNVFDYDVEAFSQNINLSYLAQNEFYEKKKADIGWSDEFDEYAKAAVDYPYYSKKEIYPVIHKVRTGTDVTAQLPEDYYAFRKNIDYNNVRLSNFSPFVKYLSNMLNNIAAEDTKNHAADAGNLALLSNTQKLKIADTLIRNEKIRNVLLDNIAFSYLLEDQNMANNQIFLQAYHQYSTDKSQRNEITRIGNAIRLLTLGNKLPAVRLIDKEGNEVLSDSLLTKQTVLFFWTEQAGTHLVEAHKKVLELKKKYPQFDYIAINLDDNNQRWLKTLSKYKFTGISEYQTADFEDLKNKWAITKVHRTIVLDREGRISNAFTSLFDLNFATNLDNFKDEQ